MVITHNFTMSLNRRGVTPVVDAVQGDSLTRKLVVTLIENGGTGWPVPSGVTAAVAFRKPDGHKGLYDKLPDGGNAVTISNDTVTAVLAPEVLSCAGEVLAAIVLHDKNLKQLATFPACIRVAANPASGQAVSNDYYSYSTMEEVSDAVEAALEQLDADKQAFLEAAAEALSVVHDAATEDAPAIVCEKTGSVISANDASDRQLKGLVLYGKTTQDGTPTPDNPVELVSTGASGTIKTTVSGKNLFDDVEWFESHGFTKQSDGSWLAKQVNKTCWMNTAKQKGTMYITIIAKTDAKGNDPVPCYFLMYYTDGTYDVSPSIKDIYGFTTLTFQTNPSKTVDYIEWTYGGVGVYYVKGVSISFIDNEYEPYKPLQTLTVQTPNGLPGIPVSSGGNYTDENGQQWICDEVDFAKGVYVQRIASRVLNGTESWGYNGNYFVVYHDALGSSGASMAICSHFANNGEAESGIFFAGVSGFAFYHTSQSVTEWKAWLADKASMGNPVTVLYELATPIETPLTAEALAAYAALHTNKPNTTVYNNAGAGMKLQYVADTKSYIDNKFTELQNAILSSGANV